MSSIHFDSFFSLFNYLSGIINEVRRECEVHDDSNLRFWSAKQYELTKDRKTDRDINHHVALNVD